VEFALLFDVVMPCLTGGLQEPGSAVHLLCAACLPTWQGSLEKGTPRAQQTGVDLQAILLSCIDLWGMNESGHCNGFLGHNVALSDRELRLGLTPVVFVVLCKT